MTFTLGDQVMFWARARRQANGCWLYGAGRTYGHVKVGERSVGAHRLAYLCARGLIPDGMMVCHRCDTPACINPAHLFLGTNADNMQDAIRKGRIGGGRYFRHIQALREIAAELGVSPADLLSEAGA